MSKGSYKSLNLFAFILLLKGGGIGDMGGIPTQ
jgi:hypothetical protein